MSNQRISRDFADANTTPEDRARGKFLARPLKIEPIPLNDPSLDDTDPANADDLQTATGIFNGIIWTVAIIGGGIGLWWLAAHMSLVLAWVER